MTATPAPMPSDEELLARMRADGPGPDYAGRDPAWSADGGTRIGLAREIARRWGTAPPALRAALLQAFPENVATQFALPLPDLRAIAQHRLNSHPALTELFNRGERSLLQPIYCGQNGSPLVLATDARNSTGSSQVALLDGSSTTLSDAFRVEKQLLRGSARHGERLNIVVGLVRAEEDRDLIGKIVTGVAAGAGSGAWLAVSADRTIEGTVKEIVESVVVDLGNELGRWAADRLGYYGSSQALALHPTEHLRPPAGRSVADASRHPPDRPRRGTEGGPPAR